MADTVAATPAAGGAGGGESPAVAGPLSRSMLFQHMTDFYRQEGVEAWKSNVIPHFIVGNARIARQYASVIISSIVDLQSKGLVPDPTEPIILLELGSGSGALAWLLMQALSDLTACNPGLPPLLVVLSDVAEANITAMQSTEAGFDSLFVMAEEAYGAGGPGDTPLPALALDWALVDCCDGLPALSLLRSSWDIQPGALNNPLLLLGTYLLDSIPQDAFRAVGEQLSAQWLAAPPQPLASPAAGWHEGGDLTLTWEEMDIPDITEAGVTKHLQLSQYGLPPSTVPLATTLLRWYQDHFAHDTGTYVRDPVVSARGRSGSVDTASTVGSAAVYLEEAADPAVLGCVSAGFCLPTTALTLLESARALTSSCVLGLFGDKGHLTPASLIGISAPHISLHGSFSLMVNFHSLVLYAEMVGGFALLPCRRDTNVATCVMLLPPAGSDSVTGVPPSTVRDPPPVSFTPTSTLFAFDNDTSWARVLDGRQPHAAARVRAAGFPGITAVLQGELCGFTPDDFHFLHEDLLLRGPPASLRQCLALCHMAHWDPTVLHAVTPVLVEKLPTARFTLKADAIEGISRAWANWYPLMAGPELDLAFDLGRLWDAMGDGDKAIAFFAASLARVGPHCVTHLNIAQAHADAGRRQEALVACAASLALKPGFTLALALHRELTAGAAAEAAAVRAGLRAVQTEAEGGGAWSMRVGGETVSF